MLADDKSKEQREKAIFLRCDCNSSFFMATVIIQNPAKVYSSR